MLLLIEKLHERQPDTTFLLTTGTVTAARMIEPRLPSYALHHYVPIDRAPYLERFLRHWQPALAVWIRSELWPNTLAALRRRAVPVILLNARMSEKSFRSWSRVPGFARELLSGFVLCLAQTENDRKRFSALGAAPGKCLALILFFVVPRIAAKVLFFFSNSIIVLIASLSPPTICPVIIAPIVTNTPARTVYLIQGRREPPKPSAFFVACPYAFSTSFSSFSRAAYFSGCKVSYREALSARRLPSLPAGWHSWWFYPAVSHIRQSSCYSRRSSYYFLSVAHQTFSIVYRQLSRWRLNRS